MRRDEELDKELRFQIDARINDLVASGVTPEEARGGRGSSSAASCR
jgi:hypothetical protein